MNYEEKVKELEKDNNRGGMHKYFMDTNNSFAIAYALLAIADAITKAVKP